MIDDDGGCIPSRQLKRVVSCPLSRLPQALLSDTAGPAPGSGTLSTLVRQEAAPLLTLGSRTTWIHDARRDGP